ncbi:MAG: nickel insertion protein, partial [Planctomycetota bacterium]
MTQRRQHPPGAGFLRCRGRCPGVQASGGDQASEVTTPTAAAVLTTLAESFGPMPAMAVIAVGYGAG